MANDQTFVASETACPICLALNGTSVPAGFTAHENCLCQTVPQSKDRHCRFATENIDFQTSSEGHVIASYEVTVLCPDGSTAGASGFVDADPVTQNPIQEMWGAIQDLADDLCDSCEDEAEEEPFNCC
jgi:hypothetical protein